MTLLQTVILIVFCLIGLGIGVYRTERKYNEAERKYGVRGPRQHWWQP